ncbi:hypothetical protein CAEBREN_22350 [Caenorhabditis brenneri]|uniref:Uncharacterized protein n=1 Tax=Caenorhabditis brenneri TaxID=135651 RepID=G0NGL8_CAEBE|nr:hypothetical protein CAEBREN_22350 [Caenorhabditis brenneri]
MHPRIGELLDKSCHLMQFLREELKLREDLALSAHEEQALRNALRMLKKPVKKLRGLQKTFEANENLVFRVHRRRRQDLREFEKSVEKQNKKIDAVVAVIMADYFFVNMNC